MKIKSFFIFCLSFLVSYHVIALDLFDINKSTSTQMLLATDRNDDEVFVTTQLIGGLGNLMFEIAAACGIAYDNNAVPSFSVLNKVGKKYRFGVFSRFDQRFPSEKKPVAITISENMMKRKKEIIFYPNMRIAGYFQSLRYFKRHENRIKQLFQPTDNDIKFLVSQYGDVINHPNSVGVQIRYYHDGTKTSSKFIQYGKDYLKKAMSFFPRDSLFVVSSNNISYAKKNIPQGYSNVLYLANEVDYLEMYLLSMCKNNIITNSSFGFWSAYLNMNPDKIVIRPKVWISSEEKRDMTPESWLLIEADFNEASK